MLGPRELGAGEARTVWRNLARGAAALVRVEDDGGLRRLVIREGDRRGGLSATEARVLARAAAGDRFKQIGFDFEMRVSTVAHHLESALRKTGFQSRIELCRLVGLPPDETGTGTTADELPAPVGLRAEAIRAGSSRLVALTFPLLRVALPAGLTAAEREVVTHVLEGRSNASIAAARRTALSTVATQLRALYRKVGVSSRAELAGLCSRLGSGRETSLAS